MLRSRTVAHALPSRLEKIELARQTPRDARNNRAAGASRPLVGGMKLARHIVEQPAMDAYRAEPTRWRRRTSAADWLDFARDNGQTIYHASGTCRMGRDPKAVVDPQLKVHGIDNLRIADASIMPTIVSANTQAAVLMIAEKAADLIREPH